jgi:hypothetical protein
VLYINLRVSSLVVGSLYAQQGGPPYVLHFASFASCICLHFYTPIGTYRDLDLGIAFLKNLALFCFRRSSSLPALSPRQHLFNDRRWRALGLYILRLYFRLAGFIFLYAAAVWLTCSPRPHAEGFINAFTASFFHFIFALVTSAVVTERTSLRKRRSEATGEVVVRGTLLAVAPFTFHAVSYLIGGKVIAG